ncbi:EamA family transporter [Salinibacterium sp. NK8237]|uniref:EamA family transporter n=1 Tax=Salinibacterium sp. NK8237 TaxID=2792038 RepID=UPI0018CE02AA|nr:EamA family transporter [Salinibacterium sp. NK8237]MBH0129257.1 EamA family transporter [Salinibacterium sp. NK8237]
MILSVVLALAAAVFYGVSDFFGGLSTRRLRVVPATTIIHAFATVSLLIAILFVPVSFEPDAVFWGGLAGLGAILGLLTFYAALADGPMSLVAPLIAVVGAVVPVAFAVIAGDQLSVQAWIAIGLALVSALLVSITRSDSGARVRPRTVVISIVSGLSLGGALIALDQAPHSAGLAPAVVEIVVGLSVMLVLLGAIRVSAPLRRFFAQFDHQPEGGPVGSVSRARILAAAGGVLVGASNAFILFALQAGSLAAVSVLVSLYPLATIVLARFTLHEKVSRIQLLGMVLALVASVMLALS